MSRIVISKYSDSHWPEVWAILQPIFRAGKTYPYATDISEAEAKKNWVETPMACYVAFDRNSLVGSFYIKANQPTLGAHICNCGYVVDPDARGKGIASEMCKFSQSEAVRLGFSAMQFNLVVETNTGAVALWQRHRFVIVGTIPKAFQHATKGLVGAHVMYKDL